MSDMDTSGMPAALMQTLGIFSRSELEVIQTLLKHNQHHIFENWDKEGVNDSEKHVFFQQLQEVTANVGGIGAYLNRAKSVLADAKIDKNPLEEWKPEIPAGINIAPLTSRYNDYETIGLNEVGNCGFVLVAGGLGERLGYSGIKLELPVETVTNMCYLELYCQQILAMKTRYGKPDQAMPLAIMVSDDTEAKTLALLERNNYFGMSPAHITLMKQTNVPALTDNDAHISMKSPYKINTKPHGHGDVHSLMYSTGTATHWFNEGVRWAVFIQDTNALGLHSLAAMLGVSVSQELVMNSLTVDRVAKSKLGAITKLVHTVDNHRELTINVEYNQLDAMLRASNATADGDCNDPTTGFSAYPGNINQLLFKFEPYLRTLKATEGKVPDGVNPKYADSSRTVFKKPTRLECMMQDFPKLLIPEDRNKVGFTTLPSWFCFAPCKNNTADGAEAAANGLPAWSPYTAECAQYRVFAELLRRAGADVSEAPPVTVEGITDSPGPRLAFHPSFLLFPCELANRFAHPSDIHITPRSALVITDDVVVQSLSLDGSLRIATPSDRRITVQPDKAIQNDGHVMVLLQDVGGETENGQEKQPSQQNGARGASDEGGVVNDQKKGPALNVAPVCEWDGWYGEETTKSTAPPVDKSQASSSNGHAVSDGIATAASDGQPATATQPLLPQKELTEVDRMRGYYLQCKQVQEITWDRAAPLMEVLIVGVEADYITQPGKTAGRIADMVVGGFVGEDSGADMVQG